VNRTSAPAACLLSAVLLRFGVVSAASMVFLPI
jgi:hypothetical protein